jgi:hypothetical protein
MLAFPPRKLNDGGVILGHAGKVPLCNCSFPSGATGLENVDWHNKREAIQPDVHVVVNNAVVGHPAQKTRQITHKLSLSRYNREGDDDGLTFDNSKRSNWLNFRRLTDINGAP